jgi:hypothetical protein
MNVASTNGDFGLAGRSCRTDAVIQGKLSNSIGLAHLPATITLALGGCQLNFYYCAMEP